MDIYRRLIFRFNFIICGNHCFLNLDPASGSAAAGEGAAAVSGGDASEWKKLQSLLAQVGVFYLERSSPFDEAYHY